MVNVLLLNACTATVRQIDEWAKQENINKAIKTGTLFEHVLYFKQGVSTDTTTLHVYIEGDGRPWLTPRRIALDPTPREPLMLKLMAMDDKPALYLGRPCYMGLSDSRNCHPWYWTSARYSRQVVDSMDSVLKQYLRHKPFTELVFFGHSGGGTLAMLLADRFKETSIIVTIAANIDTDKWAEVHAYSALNSLNPINSLPLPAHIKQYHLMGGADINVPPELTIKALKDEQNVQLRVMPDYTHNCCWQQIWAELLRCIPKEHETCMAGIKSDLP